MYTAFDSIFCETERERKRERERETHTYTHECARSHAHTYTDVGPMQLVSSTPNHIHGPFHTHNGPVAISRLTEREKERERVRERECM